VEQQMFEHVNGHQLMVKRSHWEATGTDQEHTNQKTDRDFEQELAMSICRH
jgi:hypothetical protein